ncbi:MAG TPA: squalene/phytoene synthase family protein [Solirubrobacteraceae bacterium]|nr:squalene/phytoene synthase family protein [Solirubrobacteraceae bacterium]
MTPATREAYRHCEAITRRTAANFYYGIRLLPPRQRRAMCAVYAFARRVDDIGDGPLPREDKLRRLDAQARALAALPGAGDGTAGGPVESAGLASTAETAPARAPGVAPDAPRPDPVMVALADAYVRFDVPPDALQALIAGVRMDVEGVRYESFDDLVLYCRRVAGAIGRACLAIFALRDPAGTDRAVAQQLADDLGVALQLTNILRDVREDAATGRVYLPAEDLRRFGLIAAGDEREAAPMIVRLADRAANDGDGTAADGERAEAGWLDALVRFQADRARTWFDRGMTLAPLLDRRSAACLLAMAGIYSRLLDRIAADPERALRRRVSLSMREKTWVAARSMLAGAAGPAR